MLKTTTPTLEIKTTGADLSLIETIYITLKHGDFMTVKGNDNIEVDNDIISLSLTQDEASQIKEVGGISISIMAIGYNGETHSVNVAWAKTGSRTSHSSDDGSGGDETSSDEIWYPTVSADGEITWVKSASNTPPAPRNIKGEDGKDGITPHIDAATGNWFIGATNTGVKAKGSDGEDGFSPTITENAGNNSSTYKLDITTKMGSFTTSNLKGKDGAGEGGGITQDEAQDLIDNAIQGVTSGAKIAQNGNGEWGYIPPNTNTVIPFNSGDSSSDGIIVVTSDTISSPNSIGLSGAVSVFPEKKYIIAEGYEEINGQN